MSKESVAKFVGRMIDLSGKQAVEIARSAGFPKPNVISMIRRGDTRVPLARIDRLAEAMGVDAGNLLARCLAEYEPELWRALNRHLAIKLTEDEQALLSAYRTAVRSKGASPRGVTS